MDSICKHTHDTGLEIRLTGGNCGLYYSKRFSPCVNHSKLHPDGRLKLSRRLPRAPPLLLLLLLCRRKEKSIFPDCDCGPPLGRDITTGEKYHKSANGSCISRQVVATAQRSLHTSGLQKVNKRVCVREAEDTEACFVFDC